MNYLDFSPFSNTTFLHLPNRTKSGTQQHSSQKLTKQKSYKHFTYTQLTEYWAQNKLASRANADARENQRAMEKLHIFENKLFLAEQNREKEIQKKLDSIRRHVGFTFIFQIDFMLPFSF